MKQNYYFILVICASLSLESAIVSESAASDRAFGDDFKGSFRQVSVGMTEICFSGALVAVMHPQFVPGFLSLCDVSSLAGCGIKPYTEIDLTKFRECEYNYLQQEVSRQYFRTYEQRCHFTDPSNLYPRYIHGEPCKSQIDFSLNSNAVDCIEGYKDIIRSWSFYSILGLASHGSLNVIAGLSGMSTAIIAHGTNAIWQRFKGFCGYFYVTPDKKCDLLLFKRD